MISKNFATVFHSYITASREMKLNERHKEFMRFLSTLSGPIETFNDFENTSKLIDKANELGLSDSELFLCWMVYTLNLQKACIKNGVIKL